MICLSCSWSPAFQLLCQHMWQVQNYSHYPASERRFTRQNVKKQTVSDSLKGFIINDRQIEIEQTWFTKGRTETPRPARAASFHPLNNLVLTQSQYMPEEVRMDG